jgi:hypothetical protein
MTDIVERLTKWRDDPADLRDEPESAALLMAEAAREISILRTALFRLADQNATFSVIGGNIIVDVEPTLTDAERDAVDWAARHPCLFTDDPALDLQSQRVSATLRSLLERTK